MNAWRLATTVVFLALAGTSTAAEWKQVREAGERGKVDEPPLESPA